MHLVWLWNQPLPFRSKLKAQGTKKVLTSSFEEELFPGLNPYLLWPDLPPGPLVWGAAFCPPIFSPRDPEAN